MKCREPTKLHRKSGLVAGIEPKYRALPLDAKEHPHHEADHQGKERQQKSAQGQRNRALLFRLRPGDPKAVHKALDQEIQQFHISQYRPQGLWYAHLCRE